MKWGFLHWAAVLTLVCGVLASRAEATAKAEYTPIPFENYQPILDRMPFGAPPPAVDPAAAAPAVTDAQLQAEQQKLAKQINMSCINVTPDGQTAIGFTDLNEKPPVNFYLLVGATAGGWTVVKADYDEEWAQIEKEGVTITLQLGKGLIEAPPVAQAVASAPASDGFPTHAVASTTPTNAPSGEPAFLLKPGLVKRPASSSHSRPSLSMVSLNRQSQETDQIRQDIKKLAEEGGDLSSYMERLRERKAQEKAEKAASEKAARDKLQELARKITEEELKKREREINLSLIEQGANPISDIELTPDEEARLIQKGVLTQ